VNIILDQFFRNVISTYYLRDQWFPIYRDIFYVIILPLLCGKNCNKIFALLCHEQGAGY